MVETLAEGMSNDELTAAMDDFLAIGGFLDEGLKQQTVFDLEALETAIGRQLPVEDRETFVTVQLQANRWTYIGSGMVHPKFLGTLDRIGGDCRKRIDEVAPAFA
jgi:hypothetical protein